MINQRQHLGRSSQDGVEHHKSNNKAQSRRRGIQEQAGNRFAAGQALNDRQYTLVQKEGKNRRKQGGNTRLPQLYLIHT